MVVASAAVHLGGPVAGRQAAVRPAVAVAVAGEAVAALPVLLLLLALLVFLLTSAVLERSWQKDMAAAWAFLACVLSLWHVA